MPVNSFQHPSLPLFTMPFLFKSKLPSQITYVCQATYLTSSPVHHYPSTTITSTTKTTIGFSSFHVTSFCIPIYLSNQSYNLFLTSPSPTPPPQQPPPRAFSLSQLTSAANNRSWSVVEEQQPHLNNSGEERVQGNIYCQRQSICVVFCRHALRFIWPLHMILSIDMAPDMHMNAMGRGGDNWRRRVRRGRIRRRKGRDQKWKVRGWKRGMRKDRKWKRHRIGRGVGRQGGERGRREGKGIRVSSGLFSWCTIRKGFDIHL